MVNVSYCSDEELAEIRYCQNILEGLPFESVRKVQFKLFFGRDKGLEKRADVYVDFMSRN